MGLESRAIDAAQMNQATPSLSTIMVVGSRRRRAQTAIDALGSQTIAGQMELVIVDATDPTRHPDLAMPERMRATYLRFPSGTSWGNCRHHGLKHAAAPLVAFIEDHCFAGPGWADAVVKAFQSGHAAVGYGFTNANPRSLISRASMLVDYGPWMVPNESRILSRLPGNNVAYRKDRIGVFGDALGNLLEADYNLHQALTARGETLFMAADAVTSHQNFESLWKTIAANRAYARLLASHRREREGWGPLKRLFYAVGTPVVSTPVRLSRLFTSLRFHRDAPDAFRLCLQSLLYLVIVFEAAAFDEALGYWFGPGLAHDRLLHWEADVERIEDADADR